MKPAAIFIDLDNTLIPHRNDYHTLSLENTLALKQAQKEHIYVILATGRSLHDVTPLLHQYHLNDYGNYVIAANGAIIAKLMPKQEIIFNKSIEAELSLELITALKKFNYPLKLSINRDFYFSSTPKNKFLQQLIKFGIKNKWTAKKYDDLIDIPKNINKIGIIPTTLSKSVINNFIITLQKDFPQLAITTAGNGRYVELTAKEATKGAAVNFICKHLKIDPMQTVAIGDSNNDLSMFAVVGYPIAVGNANEQVKAAARFIAPKSHKNGVAKAIKSLKKLK